MLITERSALVCVLLFGKVNAGLVGGTVGIGVEMFKEVWIIVLFAAAIALKVVVIVSCIMRVRSAFKTDVSMDTRVDVILDVSIDMLGYVVIGFMPGIGTLAGFVASSWAVTMTTLELTTMRASFEESSSFWPASFFGCPMTA